MKKEIKSCILVGSAVFMLYLGIHYWTSISQLLSDIYSAAVPLLAGCVIAYIVNIPMSFFERNYFPNTNRQIVAKSRRPVCMIGAVIVILAVLAVGIWMIVTQLAECVMVLVDKMPGAIQKLIEYADGFEFIPDSFLNELKNIDWKSGIEQMADTLLSGIGNALSTLVGTVMTVFSSIISAFVTIIFAVYLLLSKEKLLRQCRMLMERYGKPRWNETITYVSRTLNDVFHRYIVVQCMEAVILGVLCCIGMWIFRFPYAVMISTVVALTALIPVVGAYAGAIIGAFIILTVSPTKALWFLLFLIVLQQLEGNIIYPRVVGSSVGLPALWVLAAVTIGGGVMGIPGMLLGVPTAAALYRLIRDDVKKGLTSSNKTEECEIARNPVSGI